MSTTITGLQSSSEYDFLSLQFLLAFFNLGFSIVNNCVLQQFLNNNKEWDPSVTRHNSEHFNE